MMQEQEHYEEWLTTIANTRLLFNTIGELEDMLDMHAIHNNGMKRCYNTPQKLRSAFRDLKVEVDLLTDENIRLDLLLLHYQRAWVFFKEHLYRRTNPEQIALEILQYHYPPFIRDGLGTKRVAVYQQLEEQKVNLTLIILLLLKALPGYDSKEGDVTDMPQSFDRAITLLESFTGTTPFFSVLPAITRAREEQQKTRLMLIHHVNEILDVYESFANEENVYETSSNLKENRRVLDIEGFWNLNGGELKDTEFWQIENALEPGTYFATHWRKNAENQLIGIRYALFTNIFNEDTLTFYMVHPEAIRHRMKGKPYTDSDHVWYITPWLETKPNTLPFQRMMYSNSWWSSLPLTRCTDPNVTNQYLRWFEKDCLILKPYEFLEYDFIPSLYAVTQQHLYIQSNEEGTYYKVPKDAYPGFDRIQLSDNVGVMQMNNKTYLAFDEFMLYIETSKTQLLKYGIEMVILSLD